MKTLLMTLALAAALSREARAQSLLAGEGADGVLSGSPYDPPKRLPFRKHDHVQIMAKDRTRAPGSVDMKTDRRSCREASLQDWIQFSPDTRGLPGKAASGGPGTPKTAAELRFCEPDLTVAITAEVIDIRPNGVLILQAMKRRVTNGSHELLRLTGEANPETVVAGRVRMESLVNLNISYEGSGAVSDPAKPGFFGWLLGKLWPF